MNEIMSFVYTMLNNTNRSTMSLDLNTFLQENIYKSPIVNNRIAKNVGIGETTLVILLLQAGLIYLIKISLISIVCTWENHEKYSFGGLYGVCVHTTTFTHHTKVVHSDITAEVGETNTGYFSTRSFKK